MHRPNPLRSRWINGSILCALILSAIVVAGPGRANAQDATPTAAATATATAIATVEPTPTTGTVSGAEIVADFSTGDLVEVLNGPLNLREEAAIDGVVVTKLDTGTKVTITDGPTTADDHDWYEVKTAAGDTGWVAGEFLADASAIAYAAGERIEVTDGPLNVRDTSDMSGAVVTQLAAGEVATVKSGPETGDGLDWYEVEIDTETTGWVAANFISKASANAEFTAGDLVEVTDGPLNVRTKAGTGADLVTQLASGETATIVSGPESADDYTWYEVDVDAGTSGWIAIDFVALAGNSTSDTTIAIGDGVRVAVDGANLRAEAGLDADVIDTVDANALLLVKDGPVAIDGYAWYQVFNYYYGDGWIAGEMVTVDPDGFPGA